MARHAALDRASERASGNKSRARRNRDARKGLTQPFRCSGRKLIDTAQCPGWAMQMLDTESPAWQPCAQVVGRIQAGAPFTEVVLRPIGAAFTRTDLDGRRACWPGKRVLKSSEQTAEVLQAEQARYARRVKKTDLTRE